MMFDAFLPEHATLLGITTSFWFPLRDLGFAAGYDPLLHLRGKSEERVPPLINGPNLFFSSEVYFFVFPGQVFDHIFFVPSQT